MASANVYRFLTDWLSEAMVKAYDSKFRESKVRLQGYGVYDKAFMVYRSKILRRIVEDVVCWQPETAYLMVGKNEKELYAYNGRHYERIKESVEVFLTQLIIRAWRKLNIGDYYIQELPSKISKACTQTLCSSDEFVYEPDKRYAVFNNGVLDLEKYPLKEAFKYRFDCKYRPAWVFDFEYADRKSHQQNCDAKYGSNHEGDNPNPCLLIDRVIGGFDNGDKPGIRNCIFPYGSYRRRVRMFCGGLFVDRTKVKFEYMCILQGPGANGKSVFVDAISNLIEPSLVSHFSPEQLFKSSHSQFNMAMVGGKVLNVAGDLNDADFSGGDLKRFVSGERIEASKKYENAKEILPPLMLGCTNHDPASKDTSWGHYRRFLLVKTTTRQFNGEDRDTELTSKLSTDDAKLYLLHWVLSGYVELMKNKGKIDEDDEEMKKIRQAMMLNDSATRQFIHYNGFHPCTIKFGEKMRFRDMYDAYKRWCLEQRYDDIDNFKQFNSILRDMGFIGKEERDCYYWYYKTKNDNQDEI